MSSSSQTESWMDRWWPLLLIVFGLIFVTLLTTFRQRSKNASGNINREMISKGLLINVEDLSAFVGGATRDSEGRGFSHAASRP